jgi:hypothetical protein
MRLRIGVAAMVASLMISAGAQAQWTVTNLHPAGATRSEAWAAGGSQQAGYVVVGGINRASLWSGTAATWVDLGPAGSTASFARATSGSQQVGNAVVGGIGHARLWSGTAASGVDLHPVGGSSSVAYATSGSQQAGSVNFGGFNHASLWSGTAASWVDLNPDGAQSSIAYAIGGSQQAGSANFGGSNSYAGLWSGSAASWINLSPGLPSAVYGTSGSQQVGYVQSFINRASLWSGTAESWVDLSPVGSTGSVATAAAGSLQVGYVSLSSPLRASLWSGTAASWVNLHTFVPPVFSDSVAMGVSIDGATIYVSGRGFNTATGRDEALLWTYSVPEPGSATLLCLGGILALLRRPKTT